MCVSYPAQVLVLFWLSFLLATIRGSVVPSNSSAACPLLHVQSCPHLVGSVLPPSCPARLAL